jgi:hypothetical protein
MRKHKPPLWWDIKEKTAFPERSSGSRISLAPVRHSTELKHFFLFEESNEFLSLHLKTHEIVPVNQQIH